MNVLIVCGVYDWQMTRSGVALTGIEEDDRFEAVVLGRVHVQRLHLIHLI